jgi:prophage regulatory protein
MQKQRIIRKPELLATLGLSDATIWRWEKAGRFPKRLNLGGSVCGWLESEVTQWINQKAADR